MGEAPLPVAPPRQMAAGTIGAGEGLDTAACVIGEVHSPPVLAYHKVQPRPEFGITWISPRALDRHALFLRNSGWRTIHLRDAVGQLAHGASIPDKALAITFDDAYQGVGTHAIPVLRRHGLTATVFVITGYVGRMNTWDVRPGWAVSKHLDWDELGFLVDAGVEIGSHTVSHRDLTALSAEQASFELEASREELKRRLGVDAAVVSYPFGRFNEDVIAASRRAGYLGACSLGSVSESDAFCIRQKAVYSIDCLLDLKWKLGRGLSARIEALRLWMVAGFSRGTILAQSVRVRT